MIRGIDVSHFNGLITPEDWQKVAMSGVKFAILKCTDGLPTPTSSGIDSTFKANLAGARAAGIMPGGYHFFRPLEDPLKQADFFLSQMDDVNLRYIPVLDTEETKSDRHPIEDWEMLSPDQCAQAVDAFMNRVKLRLKRTPQHYFSPEFYDRFLKRLDPMKWPSFVAEYRSDGFSRPGMAFRQHTDKDTAEGIAGTVDGDWYLGDFAALLKVASPSD